MKQAEALQKAGVLRESFLMFIQACTGSDTWLLKTYESHPRTSNGIGWYYAYTVAELGAMLLTQTKGCSYHAQSGMWTHDRAKWNPEGSDNLFSTQAECYADRLICLMTTEPMKFSADFINTRLRKFYELNRMP